MKYSNEKKREWGTKRRFITINVLTQCNEFRFATCQLCKSIVRFVWLSVERHVSSIRIERPDKAGVLLKCLWSRQKRSIMVSPHATSTTKGWQAL